MKTRRYDLVDLRVNSIARVRAFYHKLLPALGFTRNDSSERWIEFEYQDGDSISEYSAITESQHHPSLSG